MKKRISFHAVPILLLFLSIGAWYGSLSLIVSPDGAVLEMNTEMLANSPFGSYLLPALLLMLFFGVLPALTAWGWWCSVCFPRAQRFSIYKNFRWPFFFSLVCGFGPIVWISVQQYLLGYSAIQTVYILIGIAICSTTLLPSNLEQLRIAPG